MNQTEIVSNMTVLDVISRYRQTEAVFKSYDEQAGECICCNALFETLTTVAQKYHLDVDEMIQKLRSAI